MSTVFPEDSVGLVTPQIAHFDEPLALACGRSLAAYDLIYETYGTLNASASNAVLICHACPATTMPPATTPPPTASRAGGTAASAPASRSTPTASSWSA
jgi:homoserine acetyltransferase